MRNITKILLLVVVAFAVYLLWPRTPDLKAFKPKEMAELQIREWQAEKSGRGMGALLARFKIYASQFHFPPITAFRIAQTQGGALSRIAGAQTDPGEEIRAVNSLREKYVMIKSGVNASFDADALAREEFTWRVAEKNPETESDPVVPGMCRIYAVLYGGQPEDFTDAVTSIAKARAMILSGEGDVAEATNDASEGYSLLREVALTPVEGSPTPAP